MSDLETSEHLSVGAFEEVVSPLFVGYAMSVITDRALPDVRDGLKPVHRRILWSMHSDGYRPDRPHVKCAKIVGSTMGTFHPHGDTALYGALVRLAQSFSLSVPLIDPHGNFGSPSDPPAAMRYSEARLAESAMAMLADIDEDTVDLIPNFDATAQEPMVLPARFPNLLVNGIEGIAVGMATKVPPHNMAEVCAAAQHLLEHPDATTADLLSHIKGPDFPTGGQILEADDLEAMYETGRGSVKLRSVTSVEGTKARPQLVVTEIPYQTSVDDIAAKAVTAVNAGQVTGVRDIRNESAAGGTRLVFDLRADTDPDLVANQLFKHTPMQVSYGMNIVALVDGVPRELGLRDVLGHWVAHQEDVITRRTEYRLRKAEDRLHIVDGLLKAIDVLDAIIALIRSSKDRADARTGLTGERPTVDIVGIDFDFSEIQANHILDLPLGRLTQLGTAELAAERKQLVADIKGYKKILKSKIVLREVISTELAEVAGSFEGSRRTVISSESADIDVTELVVDEPLTVTVTSRGYVSAAPTGARGKQVADPSEGDSVFRVVETSTRSSLVVFTDQGVLFRLSGKDLPTRKLTALPQLADIAAADNVLWAGNDTELAGLAQIAVVSASGNVKLLDVTDLADIGERRDGAAITKLAGSDDRIVAVFGVEPDGTIVVASDDGQAIRFAVSDTRVMGRTAAGSRAIRLADGARVIGAFPVEPAPDPDLAVVTVTSTGWAKRTRITEFPVQGRGGKGVRALKLTPRAGSLAVVCMSARGDQIRVQGDGWSEMVSSSDIPIKDRQVTGTEIALPGVPVRADVPSTTQ